MKPLFFLYLFALFLLVAVKFDGSVWALVDRVQSYSQNRAAGIWNANLIPFRSIAPQLKYLPQWWALKNILANIFVFVPFGVLLPAAFPRVRPFGKSLACSVALILFIELFQLITMLGIFDVDDILLNLIGCLVGYALFAIASFFFCKKTFAKHVTIK